MHKKQGNSVISVIVPVYNSANTLEYCIESIRAQSYTNLEIILIDDCSTDNSLSILKKYEEKDSRIKVIHHALNQGVSVARNTGIQNSSGAYISFVDSDDTIEPGMYEKMLDALVNSEADICICQIKLKDQVDGASRTILDNNYAGVYDDSYDMIRILYDENPAFYKDTLIQSVLNKLFRRHVFYGISFEGRFGEDCFVNNLIYSRKYRLCIISDELYIYYYT